MTAAAASSPAPSPTLDTILAAAPSGFTELTTAVFHGKFTAHDYATNTGGDKASQIEATLNHDGFVDGYGKTWAQASAGHALVEAVIAFTGGKGAHDWLTAAEAGDKADPQYVRADNASGLGTYYGAHFAYTTQNTVADGFVFVKGNDVFSIAAASTKDDVLSLATTQSTAQFSSAPDATIPSSQWPENQNNNGPSAGGSSLFFILAAVVVIAVIVLAVVMRSRRRTPAPAMYGAMGAGPMMGGPPQVAPAAVQMSDDGNFWWDGQAWKDASREAPPSAQRSSDGTLWWDGKNWRPVPQQPPAG